MQITSFETLNEDEITILEDQLQSFIPQCGKLPNRLLNDWQTVDSTSIGHINNYEYWEWAATYMLFILEAHDWAVKEEGR